MSPIRAVAVVLVSAALFAIPATSVSQTIRYVPTPYPHIQDAIDACQHEDIVEVLDGDPAPVYAHPRDRNLNFGGLRIEVRSTQGKAERCILDCEHDGRAFSFATGETSESTVRGFTIINGNKDTGGAILCDGASPKIINCIFKWNTAQHYYGGAGGAIACQNGASPLIGNCSFFKNEAWPVHLISKGGGAVYCEAYASPLIVNCRFEENVAFLGSGGAVYCDSSRPILLRCQFLKNRAGGSGHAVYCLNSDATIVNSLIADNDELGEGGKGVVYVTGSERHTAIISNCTLADNDDKQDGAALYCDGPAELQVVVTDCIVWGNEPAQIVQGSATVTVRYTDVEGPLWPGQGNRNVDPGFLSPPPPPETPPPPWDQPYYLTQHPDLCMDAGSGLSIDLGLWTYSTNLTLALDEGQVDMGYHFPRDCNANGRPDPEEIVAGLSPDCNYNGVPDYCDINVYHTSQDANQDGIPDECQGRPDPGVWTTNSEFDEGTLINVHHDTAAQLQRYEWATPLPYLWVPGTLTGTVVRLHTAGDVTDPVAIQGEYFTAPGNGNPQARRTSVDLDANVWLTNTLDNEENSGSTVKVGLVIGGTRCDASGTPNFCGNYLKPPFNYNTFIDRDGDALIRTSRGTVAWEQEVFPVNEVLPWPKPWSPGEAALAQDEAIVNYITVPAYGTRHVSVNHQNRVWVGGRPDGNQPNLTFTLWDEWGTACGSFNAQASGYGGLVVRYQNDEIVWSADRQWGPPPVPPPRLLRYNVATAQATFPQQNADTYGLAIDRDGYIWATQHEHDEVHQFSLAGEPLLERATGGEPIDRGVAVTLADNHLWVANSMVPDPEGPGRTVSRLPPEPADPIVIDLGEDGFEPTGLAVDQDGYVWVACLQSSTVKCIDPGTNNVALTVPLSIPTSTARPYAYSDMTGQVTLHTSGVGTWNVVHDGGRFGAEWHLVRWNREECPDPPLDTEVTVEVRAADFQAGLSSEQYQTVNEGKRFDDVLGKFIELRVRFYGNTPGTAFVTPVLCDLGVSFGLGDLNCDGVTDFDDIDPFVLALSSTPPNYPEYYAQFPDCDVMLADIDGDGDIDFADLDAFVALLGGDG